MAAAAAVDTGSQLTDAIATSNNRSAHVATRMANVLRPPGQPVRLRENPFRTVESLTGPPERAYLIAKMLLSPF